MRFAWGFLYIEQFVDYGCWFEALTDEEEDGDHVTDLVPEECRAVDREGVEAWCGIAGCLGMI